MILPLTLTGILGGFLGAYVLLITPPATFIKLVPWLLLIAIVIGFSLTAYFFAKQLWS